MDPQPHPLLHFLVRIKPKSTNVFSTGCQKCGSHKGKDRGCTEDVEVFPSQISEAYPSKDWQYGDGRYHAKGLFRPTACQGVLILWRGAALSATKKRTTPLCSSLLASVSNFGQTHFTLRSPPEQYRNNCMGLCVFTMHVSYPTDGSIDISVASFCYREFLVLSRVALMLSRGSGKRLKRL